MPQACSASAQNCLHTEPEHVMNILWSQVISTVYIITELYIPQAYSLKTNWFLGKLSAYNNCECAMNILDCKPISCKVNI